MLVFGDQDRWTFGRWLVCDIQVELAHIDRPGVGPLLLETAGDAVWSSERVLSWRGIEIPIVPLEVQIATMLTRGQDDRLAAVQEAVNAGLEADGALLADALAARQTEGSTAAWCPDWIRELLR